MLTQCPDCETIYRLGADDLSAAQGFVECGECGRAFNALERLADEPKFEQPSKDEAPSQTEVPAPAFVLLDAAADGTADSHSPDADPPVSLTTRKEPASVPPAPDATDPSIADGAGEPPSINRLSEQEHAILFTDPQVEETDDAYYAVRTDDASDFDDVPAVLKEELAALHRPRRSPWRWRWLLLALVLLVLAAVQAGWLMREPLTATWPQLDRVYAAICTAAGCEWGRRRDAESIQLVARDVRDHPEYRDALLVNATLLNRSATPVPFPVIQLALQGPTGELVGVRRFAAAEYLDKSIDIDAGMPPNRPVYIVMEIAQSGRGASSFEFRFL